MLSNKLTFSLVFVLALALVAAPAFAQWVSGSLNGVAGTTADELGEKMFVVFEMEGATESQNGIGAGIPAVAAESGNTNFRDLNSFFARGGTVELLIKMGTNLTDGKYKKDVGPRLVISEIVWGVDVPGSSTAARVQWVEVFNNGPALVDGDHVVLLFTPNRREEREIVRFQVGAANANIGAVVNPTILAPAASPAASSFVTEYRVVDRVSTRAQNGNLFTLPGTAEGRLAAILPSTTQLGVPAVPIVSAYRKGWDGMNYKAVNGRGKTDPDADNKAGTAAVRFAGDGSDAGRWGETSLATDDVASNLPTLVATPGMHEMPTANITAPRPSANPASLSATGVIINEVRNDTSEANLDWIELFNNTDPTAAGAVPKSIHNWELSIVMENDAAAADKNDKSLAVLPSYKLQPGEYLVIYNRDPGDTILAGGVDVEKVAEGAHVEKGASHKYVVRSGLNLPSTGKYLIILRTGNDKKGTHEKVKDIAGNGFKPAGTKNELKNETTDVWPLKYWSIPGDREDGPDFGGGNTFASPSKSFGRIAVLNDKGVYWPKSSANRLHKADWQNGGFGYQGTGYDRDVDQNSAPGTPGYANVAVNAIADDRDGDSAKSDYAFGGSVTISEVMYDAGPRWNLIQWIELYNSSMTETINLKGWQMEIRNEQTDVESFVDSSFRFGYPNGDDDDTFDVFVQPNQTLLLVSGTGVNDVANNRVYNLYEHHRRELGLVARDSRLLSSAGFYLKLSAKVNRVGPTGAMVVADEAGNVMVEGAARIHQWDLPARGDVRQSLVRQYGTRAIDGSADMANDGTMEASWNQSDIAGAGISFYGHRNDVSTPGYRLGGPLPVSLSLFRPVRNDATGHVDITWVTESELNNAGFNILRSESKTGTFKVVNVKGIVAGHGTTSEKHVYTFTDTTAKPNVVYYYQIEDVSLDGNRTTLRTTHLRGNVSAGGKLTTTWGDLKTQQ